MDETALKFLKKAECVFESYPEIKLVYLFGSTAREDRGEMSDYDFAVFVDNRNSREVTRLKFRLMDELSRLLGEDKIDLVMLDMTESPELKYEILLEGRLIFEREPYRLIFEPRVLNEYFDFRSIMERHGLTKALES